jgi:hypothetical protein
VSFVVIYRDDGTVTIIECYIRGVRGETFRVFDSYQYVQNNVGESDL